MLPLPNLETKKQNNWCNFTESTKCYQIKIVIKLAVTIMEQDLSTLPDQPRFSIFQITSFGCIWQLVFRTSTNMIFECVLTYIKALLHFEQNSLCHLKFCHQYLHMRNSFTPNEFLRQIEFTKMCTCFTSLNSSQIPWFKCGTPDECSSCLSTRESYVTYINYEVAHTL